jgi:HD-like signal output (HDOD) protein
MIYIILLMLFSRYILSLLASQGRLVCVGDVEETVLVFAALVDMSHQCVALEEVASVHKEIEGVLLRQLYALPDDVVEVIRGQVVRN